MPATESTSNGGERSRRFARVPGAERDATIEGLTVALSRLRRGAAALKAENHQLRAEVAGLHLATPGRRGGDAAVHELGRVAEIALPTGAGAPGAARMVVAHCLTGLVAQGVLENAELLASELVTNSVEHGELGDGDTVLVSVYLAADTLRLEIENPGTAGVVSSRHPGFGLDLVDRLAARWGVSRDRSTSVWFEMART
jgi:hypothetical protein